MVEGHPLVSVVVPACNAEATLAETLQSVAAQTYHNLEIIVVNDGSIDATASVAVEFCSRHPRARIVSRPKGGPAAARNLGIANARGEWIALIDADDLWHPTKVEKQIAVALAARNPPGFVYCWYRKIDAKGLVIGSGPRWAAQGSAFLPLAYLHFIRGGSSLLLSKRAFVEAGGYDESFREGCEDVVLELEIARRWPIAIVPEYLFGYRVHSSNFTHDFNLLLTGWSRAFATIQERTQLPPRLIRQVDAQRNVEIAVRRAVERKTWQSINAAMKALALDPTRSGLSLMGTAIGLATRRVGNQTVRAMPRHFSEVDTTEQLDAGTGTGGWLSKLVDRLDGGRMANFAKS